MQYYYYEKLNVYNAFFGPNHAALIIIIIMRS